MRRNGANTKARYDIPKLDGIVLGAIFINQCQLSGIHKDRLTLPADNQVAQRIENSLGHCELMALEGLDHGTRVDIIETHTFIVTTCHNIILHMSLLSEG